MPDSPVNRYTYEQAVAVFAPDSSKLSDGWIEVTRAIKEQFPLRFDGTYSVDYDTKTDRYFAKFHCGSETAKVKLSPGVAGALLEAMARWPSTVYLRLQDGIAIAGVLISLA